MTDHATVGERQPHPRSALPTTFRPQDARLKLVLVAAALGLMAVLTPLAARSTISAAVTNVATATWSIDA